MYVIKDRNKKYNHSNLVAYVKFRRGVGGWGGYPCVHDMKTPPPVLMPLAFHRAFLPIPHGDFFLMGVC